MSAQWSNNADPTNQITRWDYSYANRGVRSAQVVTDSTGAHATAYGYNDAAQLTSATSTTGGVNATYGYDKAGRRTSRGGDVTPVCQGGVRHLRESIIPTGRDWNLYTDDHDHCIVA
jgi:YD repeat-containing protein